MLASLLLGLLGCSSGGTTTTTSSTTDAAPSTESPDASDQCGSTTCRPDQMCFLYQGGAAQPDAGPPQPTCRPYPAACATDKTCACVRADTAQGCGAPAREISCVNGIGGGKVYRVCGGS